MFVGRNEERNDEYSARLDLETGPRLAGRTRSDCTALKSQGGTAPPAHAEACLAIEAIQPLVINRHAVPAQQGVDAPVMKRRRVAASSVSRPRKSCLGIRLERVLRTLLDNPTQQARRTEIVVRFRIAAPAARRHRSGSRVVDRKYYSDRASCDMSGRGACGAIIDTASRAPAR